jgi:hypothetical protein
MAETLNSCRYTSPPNPLPQGEGESLVLRAGRNDSVWWQ